LREDEKDYTNSGAGFFAFFRHACIAACPQMLQPCRRARSYCGQECLVGNKSFFCLHRYGQIRDQTKNKKKLAIYSRIL
jgi:hypothetical protein